MRRGSLEFPGVSGSGNGAYAFVARIGTYLSTRVRCTRRALDAHVVYRRYKTRANARLLRLYDAHFREASNSGRPAVP